MRWAQLKHRLWAQGSSSGSSNNSRQIGQSLEIGGLGIQRVVIPILFTKNRCKYPGIKAGIFTEFTEAVVGFIGKLVDDTIPKATIKTFPNQKPWRDKTIRNALNSHTAAYNAGIISGNMDECKSAVYGVHRGNPPSGLISVDESLVDELNTFFARFEATTSSASANNANGANGAIGAANGACAEPTIGQRPLIIKENDVRRVFKRVNTRKTAGPDGIFGRGLKACADQLAPTFTVVFNLSLMLGIVPSGFKGSTMVPIPKKPRPSDLKDYRPVALKPS
ncbi:hypothetical protein P4O66_021433 [Electrophorus voltai]|uniref:Reverse transcriptase domain-containing protein n=1 Tax=Electrophorus voltai TaxID=2609070 RepID=A0AAD8ZPH7_9TELE|nr:hypothetical protein P4O66_021433 [Electrophorus voltai]